MAGIIFVPAEKAQDVSWGEVRWCVVYGSIFLINFSEFILSDPHTVDVAYRRTKPWCGGAPFFLGTITLILPNNDMC